MKKIISLLLACLMVLSLAACGSKTDENMVSITLPASFFEGATEGAIKNNARNSGISECTFDADGNVTYTMTKELHESYLTAMHDTIVKSFEETDSGEDAPPINDLTYTDDFKLFTIYVDKENYSDDYFVFYSFSLFMSSMYYQVFAGTPEAMVDITIQIVDSQSNETLGSKTYSEWIDEMTATAEAAD